jgi:hypothetical protein
MRRHEIARYTSLSSDEHVENLSCYMISRSKLRELLSPYFEVKIWVHRKNMLGKTDMSIICRLMQTVYSFHKLKPFLPYSSENDEYERRLDLIR